MARSDSSRTTNKGKAPGRTDREFATKILLVEDDPDDALLIRLALKEQGAADWFELVHAKTLALGIELARASRFDLALLDLTLPDSRGIGTLQKFRRENSALPVVILTALDDEALAIECLDQGAQDYLVKGRFGDGVLRRALQYALARAESEDRLRRQVRYQAAVSELSVQAVRAQDISSLIAEAIVRVRDCLGADIALFHLASGAGPSGFDRQELKSQATATLPSEAQLAWQTLRACLQPHESGSFVREAQADGHSALGANVRFGGLTLGVIAALFKTARNFSDSQRAFLESIGHLTSLAVQKFHQENLLRAQEIFFRTISDNLAEGVVIASDDGTIAYSNPQACSMLGVSSNDILGMSLPAFFSPLADGGDLTSQLMRTERPTKALLVSMPGSEMQRRWIELRTSRITQLSGEPSALIALTDVSETKAMQERLQQVDRLEALSRFAGGVAHDFNNLLTVINGNAELALAELQSTDPLHQELSEILSAGEDGANLVEQLLTYTKRRSTPTLPIAVNEQLHELRPLLDRMLPGNIRLILELHPDNPWIQADPVEFKRVVMNLVANARDSIPEGPGTLHISTGIGDRETAAAQGLDGSNDYVTLAVEDTGSGIPEDALPHIFEPFFTTKPIGQGTGLGLASVYGLVRQSGGTIVCSSTPGAGTRFELLFIRCAEAEQSEAEATERLLKPTGPLSGSVLVVDDQTSVRNLVAKTLESFGLTVTTAADGREAVEILEQDRKKIDLVLSDIAMPRMTGWQLAAEVRRRWPGLPLVLMTAHEDSPQNAPEFAAETEVLPKPIDQRQLHTAVSSHLPAAPQTGTQKTP